MSEIAGMLVSALGQGFIYAPMALGVFLTFSILKTPDLPVLSFQSQVIRF